MTTRHTNIDSQPVTKKGSQPHKHRFSRQGACQLINEVRIEYRNKRRTDKTKAKLNETTLITLQGVP